MYHHQGLHPTATRSAVPVGKAELRHVIDKALEWRKLYQKQTILFAKEVR